MFNITILHVVHATLISRKILRLVFTYSVYQAVNAE